MGDFFTNLDTNTIKFAPLGFVEWGSLFDVEIVKASLPVNIHFMT